MREQTFEIAKNFTWEMGHRLPFHDGGCQNIHGHSYSMRVMVKGKLDENGMVVDYFDIRSAVAPIVDRLDHAFLCDESDSDVLGFLRQSGSKHVAVPFSSTAENIAAWLLDQVLGALSSYSNVETVSVRLRETTATYAEVSASLK